MGEAGRETDPCTDYRGPWDQEVCEGRHDHDQVFHLVSIRPPLPRMVTPHCHRKRLHYTYSPAQYVIGFPDFSISPRHLDRIRQYRFRFIPKAIAYETENTSYDLRYCNSRQMTGDFWTSDFSGGVYDTQDTFILSGFSLFGCELSCISMHSPAVARTRRPNRCSIQSHIRHPIYADPLMSWLYALDSLRFLNERG